MRIVRSLARITIVVLIVVGTGIAILRQPALTTLAWDGGPRADARALRRHVEFLTRDLLPRSAGHPENLARAASYLEQHFRAARGITSLQRFHARGREYANVIARFGPEDASQPLLVIGAHYDAFSDTGLLPGADDNASGTAALLELARLLGHRKVATPVMLVAYANEEPPFFGSEQMGSAIHANALAALHRPVRGMICFDMIGYYSESQSWPNEVFALLYPSRGDFIAIGGGWDDRALTRHVKRAILGAGGIRVVSFTGWRETSDASDHRNYWSHGWPAVLVSDTAFLRNPNYHTARDTAGTLDYERMARIVDGVASAALH